MNIHCRLQLSVRGITDYGRGAKRSQRCLEGEKGSFLSRLCLEQACENGQSSFPLEGSINSVFFRRLVSIVAARYNFKNCETVVEKF